MGEGEGEGGDTVGTVPIRGSGGRAPVGGSPVVAVGVVNKSPPLVSRARPMRCLSPACPARRPGYPVTVTWGG